MASLAPRALASLLLLAACGELDSAPLDGGASDAAPRDAAPRDAGPAPDGAEDAGDSSEALFQRDRLMRVEIEIGAEDWASLCRQSRTLETTLARPACLSSPFESPYTYFPAAVTIDGERFEQVGVRKRAFLGSLSEVKPSLRIKLDEYVSGTSLRGLTRLNLNNSIQDPSLVKQCLGYDFFARIGVPAPRCSFAEVVVNGERLGAYVHVEVLRKPFLRRHFADDEGELWEGTLSDLRDGWLDTFEQETNRATPYDRSGLEGLTRALEAEDDALLAALAPWIDLDAFLRFWAAEVLLDHWDGYAGNTNNFYLYRDPADGRFTFIPWGVDGLFGFRTSGPPFSVYAEGLLAFRLYRHPEGRRRYLEALGRLLDQHWDPARVLADLDRFAALVAPVVPEGERETQQAALARLRGFITQRGAVLRAELARGGLDWPNPLRAPPCFDVGVVESSFTTTFGTHPAENIFATGSGSFTASIGQERYDGVAVGASSGYGTNPDDANHAVLIVAATTRGGVLPVLYLAVRPELLVPGRLTVDGFDVRGGLLRIPRPGEPLEFVAYLYEGSLEVRTAAPMSGAPIDVTVHGRLIRSQE